MKHIKLFETWHSDLPQTMKMEDIKKLSPDDFLKLAEETLERGKDTDQNEFWTIWGTWYEANRSLVYKDTRFLGKLGDFMDDYDLQSDVDDILPPVMGNKKKEELDKRIERLEGWIYKEKLGDPREQVESRYQGRIRKVEAQYQERIRRAKEEKEREMELAKQAKEEVPKLEKELAKLRSEREKIKF